MDAIIARLDALNITGAQEIVADCVDSGRLPILIDYVRAREALREMEDEIYVR